MFNSHNCCFSPLYCLRKSGTNMTWWSQYIPLHFWWAALITHTLPGMIEGLYHERTGGFYVELVSQVVSGPSLWWLGLGICLGPKISGSQLWRNVSSWNVTRVVCVCECQIVQKRETILHFNALATFQNLPIHMITHHHNLDGWHIFYIYRQWSCNGAHWSCVIIWLGKSRKEVGEPYKCCDLPLP